MGLLENKVALVTGAGRGIGRAYALALAKEGAKVLVNDIGLELRTGEGGGGLDRSHRPNIDVATRVVDEIREAGGEAAADCTDVGSLELGGGIVRRAIETFGDIDIVINNAGAWHETTSFDVDDARFDAEFATTKGAMGATAAAMRHMRERGHGGRIINVITAFSGAGGMAVYSAAKAAIASLTLTAAAEGAPHGITANGISAVAVTRQSRAFFFRVGAVSPEDEAVIAYAGPANNAPLAVFLASDLSKDITGEFFRIGPAQFAVGAPIRIGLTNIARGPEILAPSWTPQAIAEAMRELVGPDGSSPKTV